MVYKFGKLFSLSFFLFLSFVPSFLFVNEYGVGNTQTEADVPGAGVTQGCKLQS